MRCLEDGIFAEGLDCDGMEMGRCLAPLDDLMRSTLKMRLLGHDSAGLVFERSESMDETNTAELVHEEMEEPPESLGLV
jgi:hypothetical protein